MRTRPSSFSSIAPWLAFAILFVSGWRIYDPIHNIPAYGDALEVIWGFEWYHQTLFVQHTSPFFTPLVFHPNGWQTVTLAHTPLLFGIGAVLMAWGATSALCYNLLVFGSLLIAFTGARRFFYRYASTFAAMVAALVFTFMGMRWWRVDGHLHVLYATSLLPWFLHSLLRCLEISEATRPWQIIHKIVISGLLWGLMINFSLYSIFFGAICFAVGGRRWFSYKRLSLIIGISSVALLLSAPLLILYAQALSLELPEQYGIEGQITGWSASVDSLFLPFRNHPLPLIKNAVKLIHQGPFDESGLMNLGPITWLLALLGGIVGFRRKNHNLGGLLWLAVISFALSLGILLRWNGIFLHVPFLAKTDHFLWVWGHELKPTLFNSSEPPIIFAQGIPLPAYFLATVVPFWESARVMARYAFVGSLGLLAFSALGIQQLKGWFYWIVIGLWLIEGLPPPTRSVLLPQAPHPAYSWLMQQSFTAGEGIVDLTADPSRMMAGHILYATLLHHLPTVSGVGSFAPHHLHYLQSWLSEPNALSKPETAYLLLGYGARYALFHVQKPEQVAEWEKIKNNPGFDRLRCFEKSPGISPWSYPICVAKIINPPGWELSNLLFKEGWSGSEEWGIWAEGTDSTMQFVATRTQARNLQISAFPYCPSEKAQQLSVFANGQPIAEHHWQGCEEWQGEITIPAEAIIVGWNDLEFRYAYARLPIDKNGKLTGDARRLSVGFSKIHID